MEQSVSISLDSKKHRIGLKTNRAELQEKKAPLYYYTKRTICISEKNFCKAVSIFST